MARAEIDRSDPAVRAALRLDRVRVGERRRRIVTAKLLIGAAVVLVFAAYPVTGSPGAVVGAVAGAIVLVSLAGAVMPQQWSAAEHRHRELEAIWREIRSDGDEQVPWDRYAAWAESVGESVKLYLLRQSAARPNRDVVPSLFSRELVRTIAADSIEEAVTAMENLRATAAAMEAQARKAYESAKEQERLAGYDDALRTVERSAREYQAAREKEMLEEVSAQEAAERRAQAEAVARGLRRS